MNNPDLRREYYRVTRQLKCKHLDLTTKDRHIICKNCEAIVGRCPLCRKIFIDPVLVKWGGVCKSCYKIIKTKNDFI